MEEEEEEEVEPSPPKKQKKEANTADMEKTKLELEDAELLEMRRKALESLTKKREDERRQEEWEEERKIIIPLNDDSSTDRNMLDRYFGIIEGIQCFIGILSVGIKFAGIFSVGNRGKPFTYTDCLGGKPVL